MGKLVFIHCDESAVWGGGTALAYNDATQRRNISAFWESNGSGNILNSTTGGSEITYKADGFATPRPVRATMTLGATSYVDFATANTLVTPSAISTKPSVTGGQMTASYSTTTGICAFFGWLREIPRKSDGTDATVDGDAEYYEITVMAKPVPAYSFVGFGFKAVTTLGSVLGASGHSFTLGGILTLSSSDGGFLKSTLSGISNAYGISLGMIEGSSNINGITASSILTLAEIKTKVSSGFTVNWGTGSGKVDGYASANQVLSFEFGKNGVAVINRTTGLVKDSNLTTAYLSSLTTEYIAPFIAFFKISTASTFTIDDLGIVGFEDLIGS